MAIEVPRGDGEVKGGSGPPMTLGSAAGAGVRFNRLGPLISTSDFQRAMMMDVDQAAKAIKEAEIEAEIEDFLKGFNQPTYRGMRAELVRLEGGSD
jgi:hypothetical protein